jgi:hypothetical protein
MTSDEYRAALAEAGFVPTEQKPSPKTRKAAGTR